MNQLTELQTRVHQFQTTRFADQSLPAKFRHMEREMNEILLDPQDIVEWADVLILFLGGAAVTGHSIDKIMAAAEAKMKINESRDWHPPDADGVCQHKEE